MRPTTVQVGPLAAPSATAICGSQTPAAAGQLAFSTTNLKGLTTTQVAGFTSAQLTGSISGNTLTVTAVQIGAIYLGAALNGAGITVGTVVTGLLTGTGNTGTYVVNNSQTFSSGTIYSNPMCILDTPRRIIIQTAADESAKTFTITGIGHNRQAQTELIVPSALSTAQMSALDFLQIGSISVSAATTGAITVGTNGVASSRWIRLDDYAPGFATVQCIVSGTVNYTVQEAMEDPNSPYGTPVLPYLVNWMSSLDTNVVGATASKLSYFNNTPTYARILLNSQTNPGFVTGVITQQSNAPL